MRALVNTGAGKVELKEISLPEPGRGQARIRTASCGICATDLQMIEGWSRTGFPSVPGHEWSGTVDAVGEGVSRELVGEFCVGENILSDTGEVGFEHPGGYAEFFVTESDKLHALPSDYPPAEAALIEPLAVCLRAMSRLQVANFNSALILGDGPIGLIMTMLLHRAKADNILVVGGRSRRLELARKLGAWNTVNRHEVADENMVGAIRAAADFPFPTVIEASGSELGARAAVELAESGGRILVLGDYGRIKADFLWNRILHRELTLTGSNTGAGAWKEAVKLATGGALPLRQLISHVFPVADFEKALNLARSRGPDVIKVVLKWGADSRDFATKITKHAKAGQ